MAHKENEIGPHNSVMNKFNVGDIIWVLYVDDLFYEWCTKQIEIETISIWDGDVEYNGCYEEKDCFATEEEAEKEISKRENLEIK